MNFDIRSAGNAPKLEPRSYPDEQHYRAKFDLWSYIESVVGDSKPTGDYNVSINTRSATQYCIVYKKT